MVRRPVGGVATLLGGGYLASGAATADRLPEPYLPGGLRFDRQEGAGEVQSPVLGAAAYELRVGDRVYLRHAKAGELCERFDRLFLVEGERDRRRGPDLPRRGQGVPLMARIDLDKSLTAPIDEVFELLTDHAGYTRFRGFSRRSSSARARRTATASAPCGGWSPARCASPRRSRRSSDRRGWTT